ISFIRYAISYFCIFNIPLISVTSVTNNGNSLEINRYSRNGMIFGVVTIPHEPRYALYFQGWHIVTQGHGAFSGSLRIAQSPIKTRGPRVDAEGLGVMRCAGAVLGRRRVWLRPRLLLCVSMQGEGRAFAREGRALCVVHRRRAV